MSIAVGRLEFREWQYASPLADIALDEYPTQYGTKKLVKYDLTVQRAFLAEVYTARYRL